MPYTPILATLGYLLSPDGQQVLLIRRDARPDDAHYGKCNGLGGKVDANEGVLESFRREFREEAGVELLHPELRGTVSWPGFGKGGEDWLGFIFLARGYEGTLLQSNPEGTLIWEPLQRLLDGELPLWEGDPHFLPLVFDGDPRPFHGVMPYRDGRPVGWRWER